MFKFFSCTTKENETERSLEQLARDASIIIHNNPKLFLISGLTCTMVGAGLGTTISAFDTNFLWLFLWMPIVALGLFIAFAGADALRNLRSDIESNSVASTELTPLSIK